MFGKDADHVVPRFRIGRHAAIFSDSTRAGVIGGERQRRAAKGLQLRQQIPCPTIEVLGRIIRIDTEHRRRPRHELGQPDRALMAARMGIEAGFLPDHGAKQRPPRLRRQTCSFQCRMVLIARSGGVDARQNAPEIACDTGAGDKRGLAHCRDQSIFQLGLGLLGLFLLWNDQTAVGVIALDGRRSIAGLGAV